jgi:GMP synthase-like glutamine amidotransferase
MLPSPTGSASGTSNASDPLRAMVTIGILECDRPDTPALIAGANGATYGEMYTEMLRAVDRSIETRVFDVVGGVLPADPFECDAWIITGARHDAHGGEPWIVALREFVRSIHETRRRLAGVCFGHQLVAEALGGASGRSGEWRAGPEHMVMQPTPWFVGGDVTIHAMHQDVVTVLPAGATVIATGRTADVPAFVVGDHILCVQDHPEYSAEYIAALVAARRPRLGDELTDDALERIALQPTDGAIVAEWIVDFLLDRRLG